MIRTTLIATAALTAGLLTAPAFAGGNCADCNGTGKIQQVSADMKATVGQPAPDFKLMDQDGNAVNLSDHKGKVVVLEQFNDQCPYVAKFYKNGDMNEMAAKAKEMGAVWLAIDSSSFSNVEENKQIASEWKIDRPLLDDSEGKVGQMYQAKTTPHMFVIDKEGTLVYAGAIDSKPSTDAGDIAGAENYVMAAVKSLMNGETPTPSETKPYGCSVKY